MLGRPRLFRATSRPAQETLARDHRDPPPVLPVPPRDCPTPARSGLESPWPAPGELDPPGFAPATAIPIGCPPGCCGLNGGDILLLHDATRPAPPAAMRVILTCCHAYWPNRRRQAAPVTLRSAILRSADLGSRYRMSTTGQASRAPTCRHPYRVVPPGRNHSHRTTADTSASACSGCAPQAPATDGLVFAENRAHLIQPPRSRRSSAAFSPYHVATPGMARSGSLLPAAASLALSSGS